MAGTSNFGGKKAAPFKKGGGRATKVAAAKKGVKQAKVRAARFTKSA